ncbi:MAG: hypothetical protein LLG02_05590 [Pelosinus sp.]|nr:hypothetical protein [Pelosinus sp.]
MFINKYPIFSAGRVLKHEMLSLLRDYPRDYADILYRDYSDGILAGCKLIINSDNISVEPGMVRYQGKIYMMNESVHVPYTATGQDAIVKIYFKKEKTSGDFILGSGDVILQPGLKLAENELELCRFKLKAGARLRDDYQNFADLATEYDTVNIINVRHAAPYEPTLSPLITRRFASEALENKAMQPFDYAFVSQCAAGEPVARLLITAYTSARLGIAAKDSTHTDMQRHLSNILSDIRQGKDMATAPARRGGRKVFVD